MGRTQKDYAGFVATYETSNINVPEVRKLLENLNTSDTIEFGFALREVLRAVEKYPELIDPIGPKKHFYNFLTHTRDHYYYTYAKEYLAAGILAEIRTKDKIVYGDPLTIASIETGAINDPVETKDLYLDRNQSARQRLRNIQYKRQQERDLANGSNIGN